MKHVFLICQESLLTSGLAKPKRLAREDQLIAVYSLLDNSPFETSLWEANSEQGDLQTL